MNIRIVIGGKHTILREGIRRMLEKESTFRVIAEVETDRELIDLLQARAAHVVILDSDILVNKRIFSAKKLFEINPSIKIIFLSLHVEKYFVEEFIKSGISGYVLKDDVISEIVAAVKSVMNGEIYISSELHANLKGTD